MPPALPEATVDDSFDIASSSFPCSVCVLDEAPDSDIPHSE